MRRPFGRRGRNEDRRRIRAPFGNSLQDGPAVAVGHELVGDEQIDPAVAVAQRDPAACAAGLQHLEAARLQQSGENGPVVVLVIDEQRRALASARRAVDEAGARPGFSERARLGDQIEPERRSASLSSSSDGGLAVRSRRIACAARTIAASRGRPASGVTAVVSACDDNFRCTPIRAIASAS